MPDLSEDRRSNDDGLSQKTPFTHEEFVHRYYVHRIASLVVVLRKDELLLTKQYRMGRVIWTLPGGLIEARESFIEAAVRETAEETGVQVRPTCLLGAVNWAGHSVFDTDPFEHAGFSFIIGAQYVSGEPSIKDPEEIFDVGFFSEDRFEELGVSRDVRGFWEALRSGQGLPLVEDEFTNAGSYRYQFGPQL